MKRIAYLDIVKVIAIIFVMMCHVPLLWNVDMLCGNVTQFWIINLSIGTLGVPLFMMTTGVLVLNKTFNTKKDVINFYRKNLLTIYVTGVIWCLIYYFLTNLSFSAKDMVKTICLINKPAVHLWYIRMILLYYLFIPLLSWLVHKHEKVFVSIIICVVLATFLFNGYDMFVNHNACPTKSGISMLCYLTYLASGYYISKEKIKIGTLYAFVLFLLGFGVLVATGCLEICKFFWYDNPFVFITSVGLFSMIKNICGCYKCKSQYLIAFSDMTFGVYLCHMLFVVYIGGWFVANINVIEEIMCPCIVIMTFILSFAMVYIFHLLPKVSKTLFRC